MSDRSAVVARGGPPPPLRWWYSGGGNGGFSSFMITGDLFVGSGRSSNSSWKIQQCTVASLNTSLNIRLLSQTVTLHCNAKMIASSDASNQLSILINNYMGFWKL